MKIILSVMLLTGCITPKNWSNSDHQDNMIMCNAMCEKRVKAYTPLTGECECHMETTK